jgi:SAM domain (Sterile alpha motif)
MDCAHDGAYVLEEGNGDFGGIGVERYEVWSSRKLADYVEQYGLKGYGSMIVTHKITGKVAPLLTDSDLKEMGMTVVGDRLRFKQLILQLGRKARYIARDKPIWRGEEQRYFSVVEKELFTCFGLFPDGTLEPFCSLRAKLRAADRRIPVIFSSFLLHRSHNI